MVLGRRFASSLAEARESYTQVYQKKHKNLVDKFFTYL
jgi:hypothetical protein